MTRLNLLIGAGGRRNYLVKWFREAIEELGVDGKVCVIDATPHAPALADADRAAVVPPFASEEYFPALGQLCKDWSVDLAFSVNDFEAARWASHPSSPFPPLGIDVIAPTKVCQAFVEDKAAYAEVLRGAGVNTPETLLGNEATAMSSLPWTGDVIIKQRYGSGSVGLSRVTQREWRERLRYSAVQANDRLGRSVETVHSGLESTVVQRAIEGAEFGVDIVHDFEGRPAGVLARKKIRMRSGETDQAVTVDPEPFREMALRVGQVTGHRGLIDTDVIVDADGEVFVIDINPRFGGGYPFSHVAGSRIPHAYIAWHFGMEIDPGWLESRQGVISAKTEDIRVALDDLLPQSSGDRI